MPVSHLILLLFFGLGSTSSRMRLHARALDHRTLATHSPHSNLSTNIGRDFLPLNNSAVNDFDTHCVGRDTWSRPVIDYKDCITAIDEFEERSLRFRRKQYEFVTKDADPHHRGQMSIIRMPLMWKKSECTLYLEWQLVRNQRPPSCSNSAPVHSLIFGVLVCVMFLTFCKVLSS